MLDREKVIEGLKSITSDDWMLKKADYYVEICQKCPRSAKGTATACSDIRRDNQTKRQCRHTRNS